MYVGAIVDVERGKQTYSINLLQQMQPIVCNFQPSSSGRGKRPRRAALGHSVCSLTPTDVDHTHKGPFNITELARYAREGAGIKDTVLVESRAYSDGKKLNHCFVRSDYANRVLLSY